MRIMSRGNEKLRYIFLGTTRPQTKIPKGRAAVPPPVKLSAFHIFVAPSLFLLYRVHYPPKALPRHTLPLPFPRSLSRASLRITFRDSRALLSICILTLLFLYNYNILLFYSATRPRKLPARRRSAILSVITIRAHISHIVINYIDARRRSAQSYPHLYTCNIIGL